MEWAITVNEEKQYAEIVTSGIADRDGSLDMVKALSKALSKTTIRKILIDHRKISATSGSAVQIYHRPMEFEEIGVTRDVKVAEVVKTEHKEFFSFLETVCVNRGYIFSIFDDKESALEWLLK